MQQPSLPKVNTPLDLLLYFCCKLDLVIVYSNYRPVFYIPSTVIAPNKIGSKPLATTIELCVILLNESQ